MQFVRNLKHIFIVFLIVFVAIFGIMKFFGAHFSLPLTHFFIYREGNPILDKLYKYKFTPSTDNIAIIKIDNESINALQAGTNIKMLGIPKSVYIDLIEKLSFVGVESIGFDIVFQNTDPDEETFKKVLESHKNTVIARMQEVGNCTIDADGAYTTCEWLPRSIYKNAKQAIIDINKTWDRRYVTFTPAWTGTTEILDTLSLAMYRVAGNTGSLSYRTDEMVLSPFFGWPRVYPSMSLSRFLSLSKPELVASFAGKYVLIGESGTLIHDALESPVTGTLMDGVETHAHFLDAILQWRYLHDWRIGETWVFVSLVILLIFIVTLYMLAPKYLSLFVAVSSTFFTIWVARYGYFHLGFVLDIVPFLMAVSIFSFPIAYIYRFFIVEREKRILTSAFAHYVDPHVVERIGASAHEIHLWGEAKNLTILFSDIAWFTTLSEQLSPGDLFYLMSSYLSRMTDILTRDGGTLDKYIGDAVMGFYGAPLPMPDHPLHACHTALEMRRALPVFNTELMARGLSEIDFRIGIATGDVVVGNIWSEDRFNYTVLGDTVNLASRLEAASKEYGTHILVSHGTYEQAKDDFYFRRLDRIAVKGKKEWIMIYELIADIRDTSMDRSIYERYESGLDLYFQERYLEAWKIFEAHASLDLPSEMMAHRCLDILEGRMRLEGGVYVMTHK
jgi:class 3 adenylate cyclase/CHASE2 domain-containing sensor protein